MDDNLTGHQLAAIWAALNKETYVAKQTAARRIIDRTLADGWAYRNDVEAILERCDYRLGDHRLGLNTDQVVAATSCHWTRVGARPNARSARVGMLNALRTTELAHMLIELETIGFETQAAYMVEKLLPVIKKQAMLTHGELSILWYARSRNKTFVKFTATDQETADGFQEIKLPNGYRYEVWTSGDKVARIEIRGPKYRETVEPSVVRCAGCGIEYLKGDPDSGAAHRKEHRKRMTFVEPRPSAKMLDRMRGSNDAELVTSEDPEWLHDEMYGRALAFKREMGFDFVQWQSGDETDNHTRGHLFVDETGTILGACAFRLRRADTADDTPPFWGLQWVWIHPAGRRSGVLSSRWEALRETYGEFFVEGPVSKSMRAFLEARGEARLMKWPADRHAEPETAEA